MKMTIQRTSLFQTITIAMLSNKLDKYNKIKKEEWRIINNLINKTKDRHQTLTLFHKRWDVFQMDRLSTKRSDRIVHANKTKIIKCHKCNKCLKCLKCHLCLAILEISQENKTFQVFFQTQDNNKTQDLMTLITLVKPET